MWAEGKDWGHVTKSIKEGKFELDNTDENLQVEVGKEQEKGTKIATWNSKSERRPQISESDHRPDSAGNSLTEKNKAGKLGNYLLCV